MKKRFYHDNRTISQEHVSAFCAHGSEHTFVVAGMPRKWKTVFVNKNHAVFETNRDKFSGHASNYRAMLIVGLSGTEMTAAIMEQNGTRNVTVSGLYVDSSPLAPFYTKELRDVKVEREVQVGDTFTSNKHREHFGGNSYYREVTVVYVGDDAIVVEYKSAGGKRTEIMRTNDSAHTSYPIYVG